MSKMSELVIDIEELLQQNYSVNTIAKVLNIPIEWVQSVSSTYESDENYEVQ